MPSHTVRILCEARSQSRSVRDAATGEVPFFWRGSSVVIQLGLADNGAHLISSGVGVIIVEVKALAATSADDSLMRKEFEAADCDATFVAADWAGGAKQLLAADFTLAEAALAAGIYRLIIRHVAPDDSEMTYVSTELRILDPQAGSEGIDAPPVAWSYLEGLPILRVDIDQVFTAGEKSRARANIGVPDPGFISVNDYATGDGVTDDTAGVMAAIAALEASSTINRLHFSGTYRLATGTADSNTHLSSWRNLILGTVDLAERDIEFTADPGSCLYQDNGSTRTHLLVAKCSFRSLTITDLRFEKSPVMLGATAAEPNGNDALALCRVDTREIEHVTCDRCTFWNMHGAVFTYGTSYDVRGKLKELNVIYSRVVNPYGANTVASGSSYGGGQQTYILAWVGIANFHGTTFEGASKDLTATAYADGGKLKDAAFFGAPMRLNFTDNDVARHGVEVVYVQATHNYLGTTSASVGVPTANGVTTATVTLAAASAASGPGTLVAGMDICIQGYGRYEVTAYNSGTRTVTFVNHGAAGNPTAGSTIPTDKFVYHDAPNEASLNIAGNRIDGTFPVGASAASAAFGIVPSVRGTVSGNTVIGCDAGIYTYDIISTPSFDQARGLIISDNTVITRENSAAAITAYGLAIRTDDPVITGNTVIVPHPTKTLGIWVNGDRARISGNSVISLTTAANGYSDAERVVGIAVGNQSTATIAAGNSTSGCDVGVGPGQHSQDLPLTVYSHHSTGDVLAVDKRSTFVFPKTGYEASPQFSAYLSANQALASGAYAKVNFNTEEFDTTAAYDNTTNYRFQPLIPGRYLVTAQVNFGSVGSGTTIAWQIRKGGTAVKTPFNEIRTSTAANCTGPASAIIQLAANEYLEIFAYQDSGVSKDIVGGATASFFQASLLP